MTNYQSIQRQFQKQGLYETNQVTFNELKSALDAINFQNTGNHQFNFEIANQIWNQTSERKAGTPTTTKDYIDTMIQAQRILRVQVQQTQEQIKAERDQSKRQDLLSDLFSFSQDHRILTSPFGMTQLRASKQLQQSKNHGNSSSAVRNSKSVLFTDILDERQQSTDLKIVLFISIAVMLLQFIIMFHKHHFFNMLCIALIVSMYVLSYFQKKYVMITILAIGVSGILDIIWLIIHTSGYWNPAPQTVDSTIQTPFLRLIIFMICLSIICRLIIIGLLFKYKSAPESLKKKVSVFGFTFAMDANPDPHNLLMSVMKPQKDKMNPFDEPGY